MSALVVVPVTWQDVVDFTAANHRTHNRPPAGHRFAVGVAIGDTIVGVASIGNPVARAYCNGWTLEVSRTCVAEIPEARNANSMLYGAAWRAARALGWRRLITYTQAGESGA